MGTKRFDWWLASAVLGHLVISALHGRAHDGGHVGLTPAQSFFVYSVILAGPIVGLALSLAARRIGGAVVAATMGASLLFGLINHFIIVSPDHVSQVVPEFRTAFATTAVLLVVTEAAGVVAGLRSAVGREVLS